MNFDINNTMDNVTEEFLEGDPIAIATVVVSAAILVVAVFAIIISIYLAIRYIKYNRKKNSCKMTGEEIARKLLYRNNLKNIEVTCSGSILFGNSYSHYFKKVRLRRLTWKKDSVSALAMAAQKTGLAVLDKENDPDMKKRIRLTPIITFGPLMFIPLVIIGVILDNIINQRLGIITIVCVVLGLVFYIYAFAMSILVLKTEKKSQDKAVKMLNEYEMVTEEELKDLQKLFKLYNIEYVNNMILALLEIIYYVLRIISIARGNGSQASNR